MDRWSAGALHCQLRATQAWHSEVAAADAGPWSLHASDAAQRGVPCAGRYRRTRVLNEGAIA